MCNLKFASFCMSIVACTQCRFCLNCNKDYFSKHCYTHCMRSFCSIILLAFLSVAILGGVLVFLFSNLNTISWDKLKNLHILSSAHSLELSGSMTITHWHTKFNIQIDISNTYKMNKSSILVLNLKFSSQKLSM